MTNAEKYKEVFGMPVDPSNCPTSDCIVCPCAEKDSKGNHFCLGAATYEWWDKEYKGNDIVRVEVTEVHTFAKPNDVSSIDFPGTSREDK